MKTINDFSITSNFTENFKQQLIDFANNDPLIIKNTTDENRFSSKETIKKWLSQRKISQGKDSRRELYFLTPLENPAQLAGIAWFTKKALPLDIVEQLPTKFKSTHTKNQPVWNHAIRLYANARGNQLSSPFLKKAIQLFWKKYPGQPVWLNTKTTNQAAQKLFKKSGFKFFHNDGERVWGVITPKL